VLTQPADASRMLERVITATAVPHLSAAPATIQLEHVAQWLYMRPRRHEILGAALKPLRRRFTWAVIDCPPSLGALTETAVGCADLVIAPCRMEARASDGLADLLELLALVRGEGWTSWRILRTQIDRRRTVTNTAVMETLGPWTSHLLRTIVPQSEALNQAQLARTDIFTFDPSCSGAMAYAALAREIQQWRRNHGPASSS
jgi:chromosome partitioning protein